MNDSEIALTPRLLLYHKQATSGRTRFLRFTHGMLAFAALPPLAELCEEEKSALALRQHPAHWLLEAARHLGLPDTMLRAETAFHADIDTPAGGIPVLLAEFLTVDPPFAAAEKLGGRFIAITEARGCGDIELLLLRRAYEIVLG